MSEATLINRLTTKPREIACSAVKPAVASVADLGRIRNKPLAYEMLEQNLGRAAALDILQVFLSSTGELVVELQRSIQNRNLKEATAALRELESSSTVVGANGVLTQCNKMTEHLLNTDWKLIDATVIELSSETKEIGRFINELLSQALQERFSR